MNRSVATQPQFDSISIEINSALIEQNSSDRIYTLPATGFDHAIRQNYRHLGFDRSHRFIDIGSQLGRSCAAWLLTTVTGGAGPGSADVVTIRAYTTERCRPMQLCNTSSIGFSHQALEKISISE